MNKCKRGHSTWHKQRFVQANGKIKIKCDYIIGYRLKEGQGSKQTIICGDLPIGSPMPKDYQGMGDKGLVKIE